MRPYIVAVVISESKRLDRRLLATFGRFEDATLLQTITPGGWVGLSYSQVLTGIVDEAAGAVIGASSRLIGNKTARVRPGCSVLVYHDTARCRINRRGRSLQKAIEEIPSQE